MIDDFAELEQALAVFEETGYEEGLAATVDGALRHLSSRCARTRIRSAWLSLALAHGRHTGERRLLSPAIFGRAGGICWGTPRRLVDAVSFSMSVRGAA